MKNGNWASQHTINGQTATVSTFTNMPAIETFLFNSHRHILIVDVSGMSNVRMKVNKQGVAAPAGAKLILRYSPVFSKIASDYIDIAATEVSVAIDVANSYLMSEWIELKPEAVGCEDIFLAVIGSGGDGVLDPQFGNISVSFN